MGNAMRRAITLALLAIACSATAQQDATRNFPSRPLRIVVGYSVGGGNDIIARIVAQKLGENLGQSVVVENKPGVASIIAAEYVAKSPPDGYTLLMGPSGPLVFNPAIYPKLSYSPQKDFAPIGLIGAFPLLLVVNQNNPAKNVKDLVEAAKAAPERAFYGASAASFQFATELFNLRTGAKFQRVPYKGANDSAAAVASGDVTLTIADPAPVASLARAGKLKVLATTAAKRVAAFPEVPTMAEAGVPGLEIELWAGLLAPAGTPAPIVKRLQDELARTLASADVKTRLQALSINVAENPTPDAFARTIAAELEIWAGVAKSANIKAE